MRKVTSLMVFLLFLVTGPFSGLVFGPVFGVSQAMAQNHTPSFSCNNRLSPNERLICSHAGLANMDVNISNVYHELTALLNRGAADIVRSDQRNWVRQRQGCGHNYQCTNGLMHNRLSTLHMELQTQKSYRNGATFGTGPGSNPSYPPSSNGSGKANCSVFNMVEHNGQCVAQCPDETVLGPDKVCRVNDEVSNPNPCGPGFYQIRGRCISSADVHENTSFCGAGSVLINRQCFPNSDIQFRP